MDSTGEDACQGTYQEKHDVVAGDACLVLHEGDDDDGAVLFDTTALASARYSNNKPLLMTTPCSATAPEPTGMTFQRSPVLTMASGDDPASESAKVASCAEDSDDLDLVRDPETTSDLSVEENAEDVNIANAPSIMNFDAFVAGPGNEAGPVVTLAVVSLTPRSPSPLRPLTSMRNAAAKLVLVKEKTHEVAQSQKLALANFHKNGGLVGWLHGGPDAFEDASEEEQQYDDSLSVNDREGDKAENATLATESVEDTLRSASLPSDLKASSSTQAPPQHRSFSMHQQIPSLGSNSNTSGSFPTRGFIKNSLSRTQHASSLLENLYEKMKGTTTGTAATVAATSPLPSPNMRRERRPSDSGTGAGARVALQPSPRKQVTVLGDLCSIGFDDFAASSTGGGVVVASHKVKADYNDIPHQRNGRTAESSNLGRPLLKARLSLGSFSSLPLEPSCPREDDAMELSLDECLADKKLAAEFVNTVMPDDATLLKLLYSIEDFETLVTTEPILALSVQVTYATTLIDKFLVQDMSQSQRPHSWISKLPKNLASDLKLTIEQLENANATTLPTNLFQPMYDVVYSVLRDGYEAFTHTREYAHLLEQHRHQQQHNENARGPSVLTMTLDLILANEWYCTVFWMHLYRTLHHHRLSFLMDKAFKLDKLYRKYLENTEYTTSSMDALATDAEVIRNTNCRRNDSYANLVRQLKLMARKYLQKTAPASLPVTTAPLCRLKEEICVEITHLAPSVSSKSLNDAESDLAAVLERVMTKLEAFSVDVQKEFKQLSFERFTSFTTSTLYRDFIAVLPPSLSSPTSNSSNENGSMGDVVQLLRASRISFHQAPNDIPQAQSLSSLCESSNNVDTSEPSNRAIYKVFSFVKRDIVNAQKRTQPYEFVDLLAPLTTAASNSGSESPQNETTPDDETHDAHAQNGLVYQRVEHFLIPEASPRTFQITDAEAQQNVCFNFVAGNDENAVYGAVWRLPFVHSNGITTQGVCVLSKYPLVDSMRHFLRVFVETKARLDREKNPKEEASTSTSGEVVEGELNTLTLREAQQAFDLYFKTRHIPPRPITQAIDNLEDGHLDLPSVDISLQDLFDCLSITHILRLVALALLEKKIVLVSSSYSVLLTVGESLKSLLYPLTWSHIYVPVLPLALKGYLHCPTPFIFGLHNSYVRNSELPRAADDLVIVNLDRDSLTGGGDVSWPPTRNAAMRDRLVKICKPRLQFRDNIEFDYANGNESRINEAFPTEAIRRVLYDELQDMLSTLEAFAFRFAFHDKFVTVVDSSNKSRMWASDTSRFYAMLLQTQAFSAHLSSLQNL